MFAHELSISNHQSVNQHFLRSKLPLTRIMTRNWACIEKIFLLQQLEKAIKHERILHSNIRPCIKLTNIFVT